MAVRKNAGPKQPCRDCPKAKPAPAKTEPVTVPFSVTEEEGRRLWKHVLFGTGTCINMIEGYVLLNMHGDPLDGVRELRDRLNHVISRLESRPNVTVPTP